VQYTWPKKNEINYWTSSPTLKNTSHYSDLLQPVMNAGQLVGILGYMDITDEISVAPCIGHTPGHQCVFVQSQGQSAVIIGDVMHHPVQVQMPSWSAKSDWDVTYAVPTRRALIEMVVGEMAYMVATHFEYPGVGTIVQDPAGSQGRSGYIYVPMK